MSRRGRDHMVVRFTTEMFKMFLVITYSIMKRESERKSVAAFVCLSLFFWILHYLPFLLAIVLSPFSLGYCIISLFFWLLYYLSLFFGYCIISLFFWLLYYLSLFLLAIVLSPFPFGYCIISLFFWLLYFLPFLLAIVLSVSFLLTASD